MSYRWSTKEDMLEDLAEMTGGYTDVDEEFIVVGEKPPPVRRYEEDDDEFNLRFSGASNPYEMQEDKGPDLVGITQMLRMVEDHDVQTTENGVPRTPEAQKNTVITISKLNPNVPEFVPKGAIESSPRIKKSLIVSAGNSETYEEKRNNENAVNISSKTNNGTASAEEKKDTEKAVKNNSNIDNGTVIDEEKKNTEKAVKNNSNMDNGIVIGEEKGNSEKAVKNNSHIGNGIVIDKKIDVSKLNAEEIKDISRKLRNKISDVSKKEDLGTKREKNVAIAALLKLHTAPQRRESEEKEIKLFTPEYFATCPAEREVRCEIHDVIVNVDSKLQSSTTCLPSNNVPADKTPEYSDRLSEKSTKQSRTVSSVEDDTSTSGKSSPKSYIESPNEMNHFPHDPNVQKSIKKVTSWLQKPESPKPGPVVCLAPLTFKKKSVKSSASASNLSSSRSSSSLNVNTHQIGHFVPSKRAEDLSKKYSKRGQEIERQSEDIWTRAINEMKAIDKKKLEQLTSQSDNDRSSAS